MDSIYGALQAALQLLDANPVLLLLLLMGSGYLLGNIKVLGFSLGPVAGILFAGIFLGHYGLRLGPAAQSLGMLSFTVGGIAIGLGTAGGLLAAGLGIGYMRSVRPTFGRLPEATSWWLMEFGLLLFMAGVGLSAGGKFIDTLTSAGPLLVVAGPVVLLLA